MEIEVIERKSEPLVYIEARPTVWMMPFVIGRAYHRMAAYLEREKRTVSGEPFVHYLDTPWEKLLQGGFFTALYTTLLRRWHMRICMPVDAAVPGEGSIKGGTFAGGRYAKAVHRGSYKAMKQTYEQLYAAITDQGLEAKNECIEVYRNDPKEVEERDLETVILVPLAEE